MEVMTDHAQVWKPPCVLGVQRSESSQAGEHVSAEGRCVVFNRVEKVRQMFF